MPFPLITDNIAEAILERQVPTVTRWNRLEGRPRTDAFERALGAEVRDALWLLTRQWQMGEFHGDNAASPILAKVHLATSQLARYRAGAHEPEPFDPGIPLETRVEARAIESFPLDLRLLMGRQWLKLMRDVGDFSGEFLAAYPIEAVDPADAAVCAHPEAWSAHAAVAQRRVDGARLYAHLGTGGHAWDGIAALDPHRAAVDERATRFRAWFARLIHQPGAGDAWVPDRLEYQFACSAPEAERERVLLAEEYYHGHLDWYAVDVGADASSLGGPPQTAEPATDTQVLLPAPVAFDGMPNTRWWAFEDGRTNFGEVRPDTTDLAKLLLMEFALVYANDWMLIPYTLTAGSVASIRGIAVTDVFGERTWIEAAGSGDDADWQRWAMFLNSVEGEAHRPADTTLHGLPVAVGGLEGPAQEEVLLIRDEVANMVWGVERTISLATGEPKPGAEAARETRAFFERALERRLGHAPEPPAMADGAHIRYRAMTDVPEHWVPFIPVHVAGQNREIQLQRARILRTLEGDTEDPLPVEPRTSLLRVGLPGGSYVLHEEEVPRAGVRITQGYQRTRWRDGRAWVWLGVRKRAGRGEGSSGLAFDYLQVVPPQD